MRITYDIIENRFLAELSLNEHWNSDLELVKAAKFKTKGPPNWHWFADRIAPLDYLRKNPPASGLTITELALEKYRSIKQQSDKKQELKKLFVKAKKVVETTAADEKCVEYECESGVCIYVKPSTEKFVWKYTPPAPPENRCFVCGDFVYDYEGTDLCLWCSANF